MVKKMKCCEYCNQERRLLFSCRVCGKMLCKKCINLTTLKCRDCETEEYVKKYSKKFEKYSVITALVVLFWILGAFYVSADSYDFGYNYMQGLRMGSDAGKVDTDFIQAGWNGGQIVRHLVKFNNISESCSSLTSVDSCILMMWVHARYDPTQSYNITINQTAYNWSPSSYANVSFYMSTFGMVSSHKEALWNQDQYYNWSLPSSLCLDWCQNPSDNYGVYISNPLGESFGGGDHELLFGFHTVADVEKPRLFIGGSSALNYPYFTDIVLNPTNPTYYVKDNEYWFNISWFDSVSFYNAILEFNGVNYSMYNVSSSYYKQFYNFPVGNYNFRFFGNNSEGNINHTIEYLYTIGKDNSSVLLSFDKTSPQYDNTTITPSCSVTSGEISFNLYRNGTSIPSGVPQSLPAGTYYFNCVHNESQNFTASNSDATFIIEETPAYPSVSLLYPTNFSSQIADIVNWTFQTNFNASICSLYSNVSGSFEYVTNLTSGVQNTSYQYNVTTYQNTSKNLLLNSTAHWSLNQSSGDVVIDDRGFYNGTRVNMELGDWTAGVQGNALQMDGTNEYTDYGGVLGFNRFNPFTFAFWMKTSANSDRIITKYDGVSGYSIHLTGDGKITIYLRNTATSNEASKETTVSVNNNSWVHIGVTYDGSSSNTGIKIYVNGEDKTATGGANTLTGSIQTAENFLIGAGGDGYYYNGLIDDVFVFNRTLTANELNYLRNFSYSYVVSVANTTTYTNYSVFNKSINASQFYNLSQSFGVNTTEYVSNFVDCDGVLSNYQSVFYNNVNDTTKPYITVFTANYQNFTVGKQASINFNAFDLYGIKNCSLWVDGVLNSQVGALSPYLNYTLNSSGIAIGLHSFYVKCYDNSNNFNNSVTQHFRIVPNVVYSLAHLTGDWFNIDGLETGSTGGMLYYFFLFFLIVGIVVFAESIKIPMIMVIAGICAFFFGLLLYVSISGVIGLLFIVLSVLYIIFSIIRT